METKANAQKELIKISFPLWFRVFYSIGAPIVFGLICLTLIKLGREGFTAPEALKAGFLILIVALGFYAARIFFSTVSAKESGIQRHGVLCGTQVLAWDEITTVRRGRFGIPHDVAYIMSASGQKIAISRGMSGYYDLLRMIESRARNLTTKQVPSNLWPSSSARLCRHILIFLALFLAYIVIRKILGW